MSLRDLWTIGLPSNLTFTKIASSSSNHVSDHKEIDEERPNAPLGIATDFSAWVKECALTEPSLYLLYLKNFKNHKVLYGSEDDIQMHVELLIRDLIRIIGLQGIVQLVRNCSVTNEKYGGHRNNKLDYWVILLDGRPIVAIDVKSPRPPTPTTMKKTSAHERILEDPKVVGQACDYMLDVHSFNGKVHVFCITATMEQFRVHWFPSSDEYAGSVHLPVHAGHHSTQTVVAQRRAVCSSRVFHHSDGDLIRVLATVLIKSYCSPFQPVHLVHENRLYIELRPDTWVWRRFSVEDCNKLPTDLSLTITHNTKRCANFTVLKSFYRGAARKVWLTIADASPPVLVVIKQLSGKAEADLERCMWERVNGCLDPFCIMTLGLYSVAMPLAIHAKVIPETNLPYFDFNLERWCADDNVILGNFPACLRQLSEAMQSLASQFADVHSVAVRAIELAAAACVVHDDLEWRHIALLPVIIDGNLQAFKPILIDFGRVHTVESAGEARAIMLARLEEMMEEVGMAMEEATIG